MDNPSHNMYNFVFWKNTYEGLWYAIERDSYLNFTSGRREKAVHYKSKDLHVLEALIENPDKLRKLMEDSDQK